MRLSMWILADYLQEFHPEPHIQSGNLVQVNYTKTLRFFLYFYINFTILWIMFRHFFQKIPKLKDNIHMY